MRRCVLAVALLLVFAAPARAAILQDFSGFQSGTNGIVLGPDGNFWVAEQYFGDSVARMTPAGRVLDRFNVGAGPTTIATGPNGTVWVAVTDAKRLVWFDATAGTPTAHPVPTPAGSCGPVAITDGGNGRMYFSLP